LPAMAGRAISTKVPLSGADTPFIGAEVSARMAIQLNNVGSNPVRDQARTDATQAKDGQPARDADAAKARSEVELSPHARKLKSLAAHIAQMPAVDAKRVESIRRAISEGRYPVDPARVAAKFLEIEGEL